MGAGPGKRDQDMEEEEEALGLDSAMEPIIHLIPEWREKMGPASAGSIV